MRWARGWLRCKRASASEFSPKGLPREKGKSTTPGGCQPEADFRGWLTAFFFYFHTAAEVSPFRSPTTSAALPIAAPASEFWGWPRVCFCLPGPVHPFLVSRPRRVRPRRKRLNDWRRRPRRQASRITSKKPRLYTEGRWHFDPGGRRAGGRSERCCTTRTNMRTALARFKSWWASIPRTGQRG